MSNGVTEKTATSARLVKALTALFGFALLGLFICGLLLGVEHRNVVLAVLMVGPILSALAFIICTIWPGEQK